MNVLALFMRWKLPLFFGILLSVLYLHYFENRAFVELDISVSQNTWFKIYYAEKGHPEQVNFEKFMRGVRVTPDRQHYTFHLTDLRTIGTLRIDPHEYSGGSWIHRLCITQNGLKSIRFSTEKDFSLLQSIGGVESSQVTNNGLATWADGNDPRYELPIDMGTRGSWSWLVIFRVVAIFAFVFLLYVSTETYWDEKQFVPLFLVLAFVLILIMAVISERYQHPDEAVHLAAAEYYITNWLPPVVDDPAIRHSYSPYGVSRLNSPEVAYFIMGKFEQLVSIFKPASVESFRSFNVLLFFGILLYFLKTTEARFLAVPLLVSPQIWYIFSYCNSDAFAIVLTFLVSCQVVLPDSLWNSYLLNTKEKTNFFVVLLLGIICALLLLLKKNYYVFLGFLVGYLLWRMLFFLEPERKKQYLKRIVVVVLFGVSIAGLRIGTDYVVNGWDRSEKIAQVREEYASPLFKPSTPLEKKHTFLYRKARGDSLKTLVERDHFFEKTFMSTFGVYGHHLIVATDEYYNSIRVLGIGLLGFLFLTILLRGGWTGNLLFFYFLGCSGALILASLYHAWTADFQAQGRYLFPIVPMCCIVLYHFRHLMQGAVYKIFIASMFLMSAYSFIFYGLFEIHKM